MIQKTTNFTKTTLVAVFIIAMVGIATSTSAFNDFLPFVGHLSKISSIDNQGSVFLMDVDDCCPDNLLNNGSFENDSPNFTEAFPNSSISSSNNSITTSSIEEWSYEDGQFNNAPIPLISDPTRASHGDQMLYIPIFDISTSFNRCIGDLLDNGGEPGECPNIDEYNNNLRYLLKFDFVIFNRDVPEGGASAGGGLPAAEYINNGFFEIEVYDEDGHEYELSNGLIPAVGWDEVATSWETAYAITPGLLGSGIAKFYFSTVNSATAGMLVDNVKVELLQVSAAVPENIECTDNTNEIRFTLNPESNLVGPFPANYIVRAPTGYSISPSTAPYGEETTFILTIQSGDFSSGLPVDIQIEVEDEVNDNCFVVATINNPYPSCGNPYVSIVDTDITCGPTEAGGSMVLEIESFPSPPLTINWSDDSYDGLSAIDSLPVGIYSVTVTDQDNNIATATAEITIEACQPNPCVSGEMGGTVFNDPNADGVNDGNGGFQGITVQIFACNADGTSELIETTYTDVNGDYHFTSASITDGTEYRIEFSNLPDGFTSSIQGTDNGTETQYVDAISCDVDYGIINPDDYCSDDPLIAAVCFARNNDPLTEPTIIFVKSSDARDWPGPANANDTNGNWGIPSGSNATNYPLTFVEATNVSEVNTTLGMDFDIINSRLITGSYMRAYAPMNTNASANGFAEAALYQIPMDLDNASAGTPSLWLDLEDLIGNDVAGTYLPDATFPGPAVFGRTGSNPNLIGYTGLGSIKISKKRNELYTVNLATREVYVIPIGADGSAPTSSSDIKVFPLPSTECSGNWEDGRDLRAVLGLGVHPESGRVYASLTCTGPNLADMTGYVYSFDPSDDTPSSGDFDLELSVPLNIERPATSPNTAQFWDQTSHPWESVTANNVFYLNDPRGFFGIPNEFDVHHNMPWLADIEFGLKDDGSYSMIIGERNRYHDQISTSFYVVGGVMYKACGSEGNWSLSNGISCGSETSTVNFTDSGTRAGAFTSVHSRYMMYVGREGSMGSGFMTLGRDGKSIVSPVMDNLFNSATSGLTWINYTDGGREADVRILGDYTGNGYNQTNFTKANNWGSIASMCGEAHLQIGNYVWIDANGDGIQDPCEEPLQGMTVKLYTKPVSGNAELVATTTTDANGQYYFTSNLDTDETWEAPFTEVEQDSSYFIVFCGDSYNADMNVVNAGGLLFALSPEDAGMGLNPDFNDSDAMEMTVPGIGDLPVICVTVDSIDHTLDVGLLPKPDVALVMTLDPFYDPSGISFGDSVKFKIVVENQSLGNVDSLEITNYLPSGYTFDGSQIGNEEWDVNPDGNPVVVLRNTLQSLERDSVCIYLNLEDVDDPSEWVTVSEISEAYGGGEVLVDCDSPLNDNPDDNVGSEINTPADDYLDGDGSATGPDGVAETDQDNVDPAVVPICDLALINELVEVPSSISVGDTLKYHVVVENQGTVPASNIDIFYTIPNGLEYTDANDDLVPSWNDVTDAATTTIVDTLGIGEHDTICIYLTLANVPTDEVTDDSWTTFAEIAAFEDPAEPGVDKPDFDSTPNDDPTDDPGGNPDDNTDNETDGDGSGDPDDPTEDTDPTLDEDDHDPAIIYVCDAAIVINTEDSGPFQYQDTVKFNVVVFNQGNGDITNVNVNNFIGEGYEFISSLVNTSEGWTVSDDTLSVVATDIIVPGASDTICVELMINAVHPFDEDAYLQEVEIESFEDPAQPGDPKEDIDSTPDDDPTNDPGGNPDDNTDDETDGDGSGDPDDEVEDTDPELDEDDHDPVIIPVFDLALTKEVVDDRTYSPGEMVQFEINVYNQGNQDVANYNLTDYIRDGFTFSSGMNAGWSQVDTALVYTSSSSLAAGDTATVYLNLVVVVPSIVEGVSTWWNYVEISSFDDDNNPNNTDPMDADSSPDSIEYNDNDVEPGDDEDDEVTENGLDGGDQDDHDPAAVIVGYDIALAKTVSPSGPYSYGDTLTYSISLTNQGGLTMSNISVYDTLPCGLEFLVDENMGWNYSDNVATTTYAPQLLPSQSVTLELKARIQICDEPGYGNYYNVAEVSDFLDEDGNEPTTDDIDSTPNDNPSDDGEPNDNQITDPMDEDDHDFEDIVICDVALINTISEIPSSLVIGDTIKYEVIVQNQGNHDVNSVSVDYSIPNGLEFLSLNASLDPVWNSPEPTTALITTNEVLAPGESDTICLYLELQNVSTDEVTEDSWTTIAEIYQYTNQDDEIKTTDADSSPDNNPDNDPGGNPDDDTDDELDGDGTGDPMDPTEDSDPELDEDDHDPAIVYVCDVATIIDTEDEGPFAYGDTIKYEVHVHNQGNGPIVNVDLQNLYGEGLVFLDMDENEAEGWDYVEEGELSLLIEEEIGIGEIDTICLYMEIVPDYESEEDSWAQNVEVVEFEDPNDLGEPKEDIDSNPDDNPANDPGGNIDDEDTDDVTDGNGNGDSEDEEENTDPELDEDDQDVEDIKVYDLALYMQLDSMPPVLPVVPEDVLKFIVVVHNQGNVVSNNTRIVNYIMPDNLILSDMSTDWLSETDSTNSYIITDPILPGDIDTVCIYVEVVDGAMADIILWSEIEGADETDGECYDIDSDPNDTLTDDSGGNPDDTTDDYIEGNGEGDPNDPSEDSDPLLDEDDHDPATLQVQDLALIMWSTEKDPVIENQDVLFKIQVINQGGEVNENIRLVNYLPVGFELSPLDTNNWVYTTEEILLLDLEETLLPGDTLETCILLRVQENVAAHDLIVACEIFSSTDSTGMSFDMLDIDSTPDSLAMNDGGGLFEDPIDCSTLPDEIGDDNNVDGDDGDEDDHDPAWPHVLDLATIIYPVDSLPVIPGDDVKYNVVVTNQGNMSTTDIELFIEMPDGFTLSVNDTNGWDFDDNGQLELMEDGPLNPGEMDTICLVLEVLPDFTLMDLIPIIEIEEVKDSLGNLIGSRDIDSSPNDDVTDDEGGIPFTETDDELNGNGADDEDDQDPAVPVILDLAINIVTSDMEPKKPGDIVKFDITIYNQGSLVPQSFIIDNYLPEGLDFVSHPGNAGWEVNSDGVPQYVYEDEFGPLSQDSLCIYLIMNDDATPLTVVNMVEISNVIDEFDNDVSILDIDSEADGSNENDLGNDIYSLEDNKLHENGRSGEDEDDHDQAFVNMCLGMVCNGALNISLDETCDAQLTPSMLISGDVFPDHFYEITITDENGVEHAPTFTGADIGQSYVVEICNPFCDNNCCWVDITVEDKFPPQIECPSDTISCGELVVFPVPVPIDNCSGATIEMVNETIEDVACDDPELRQVITREWRAVDAAGNISDVCVQTLSIRKFDIGEVQPPLVLEFGIECDEDFATDGTGNPDPLVYGGPLLGGQDLWQDQFLECNLLVNYSDLTLQTAVNTTSIVRTWEAQYWSCGFDTTAMFVQVFTISDTQGPVIDCPGDLTFTTSGIECAAEIQLPTLNVVDACSDIDEVTVQYEGGFINGNGGIANLPVGSSEVTYRATDVNGFETFCTFNVTVSDQEQPIAVCEQFTTVTLTNQGTSIVSAESFDDGSFDACGDVTIEVRRMNASCDPTDSVFGEEVTFCCADLGVEQMVVLRVTDESGNTNECMIMAEVQDKVPPVLVQGLPDITLSCEFPFNEDDTEQFGTLQFNVDDIEPINLTAELVEFSGAATDGLVLGNCIELVSSEIVSSDFNSCGIGSAVRVLTVANGEGVTVTDVQNITFVNPSPFTIADIEFPGDLFFNNLCDLSELNPNNLEDGFNFPVITEDGCDQVGFDYEDDIVDSSNGAQSCYVLTRTWTVIDWCQNDGGTFETFEGTQTITVINTTAPEITGDCTDRVVESLDPDCGPIYIELVNSATDDCTSGEFLNFSYAIDAFSDGTIDFTGNTSDASGSFPVGTHTISWIVNDGCGNEDNCSYTFTLNNTKLPSPKCLDNLTGDLTGVDTNGDGLIDTALITVTPEMFDAGSDDPCGTPIQLSFSEDVNDVSRTFGCDDIGENFIQLWVTDENGNQDFCITTFEVQDNFGLCPAAPLTVDITGELKTEMDEMIALGEVALEGGSTMDVTDEDGVYGFLDMPTGGDYVINPLKDIDHGNGITVSDIILIQKHILGLSPLNSPYKILAADVDNSEKVNGTDIIQIRKLLLGYYDEFPNNTSWRFVDGEHEFLDPSNPWFNTIPETYDIYDLGQNMIVDFRGYKVGDVNNTATPNDLIEAHVDTRNAETQELIIDRTSMKAGETEWIHIYKETGVDLAAMQLGLTIDSRSIEILEVGSGQYEMDETTYKLEEESLRVILAGGNAIMNSTELPVLSLLVRSKAEVNTLDVLSVNDEELRAEAYTAGLEIQDIAFKTRLDENSEEEVGYVFDLNQNEPNPWISSTTIVFTTPKTMSGRLNVLDMNGKVVVSKEQVFVEGENAIIIDRADLSVGGVYYYEIVTDEVRLMKKMIVIQ